MAQVQAAGSCSLQNVVKDEASGLDKVVLRHPEGASAEIFLHGAHLTSWKTPCGRERIFVSAKAVYKPPKAIRGGIPVCFPQFGSFGPLQQHGFARNSPFRVETGGECDVTLLLEPSAEQLQQFPHPFELRVKVELRVDSLHQTLSVVNVGGGELSFTTALHTYFTLSGIDQVHMEGLQGLTYLNNLDKQARQREEAPTLEFPGEVDRIYLGTPDTLRIVDKGRGEAMTLTKRGFPDAVAWNPWVDKAAGMADFGDEEYKEMVCLEAAAAGSGPITLAPGKTWEASQTLTESKL